MTAPARGEFRASLHLVEDNLFRAEYLGVNNAENPSAGEAVPDYHIGTSAESVKTWVEQMAAGLGYDRVVWS